ncbi:Oxysterol-binding protein-related protein 4B [Forsythia ovata]|uniref:Oxysterol-binding protein-related protein 4B n=1 Tax=Forsythia ovata TaxID=205694 RepID=A0ABD1P2U9_9LAMI
MVSEGELGAMVVLTAPLSLERENSDANYRAPNVLQRILSLLNHVRPGSDLTRIQLPPMFNLPKSQLQCYGESVYCNSSDMLNKCAKQETALDRFTSVVAWSISTVRPLMFGVAPYNPVLGETHHVSRGTLNVLLEQVSHHPPVTALHATDEKENMEIIWCHHPLPKFYGTHIETEVQGKRLVKLLDKNETYIMNSPKLVIRFFPVPSVDWMGNVTIQCQETGLEAELSYRGNSFLPRPSVHRSIKGKIFMSSSSNTMYVIDGHWDRTVTVKDVFSEKVTVIYNAEEAISGLKTPIVKDPKGILPGESTLVWAEVSKNILENCWDKAKKEKNSIEERQRELAREAKLKGECWSPKHFTISHSDETGWDCLPNQKLVPPAPIVVPPVESPIGGGCN